MTGDTLAIMTAIVWAVDRITAPPNGVRLTPEQVAKKAENLMDAAQKQWREKWE